MGAAKRRGNFEERRAAAEARDQESQRAWAARAQSRPVLPPMGLIQPGPRTGRLAVLLAASLLGGKVR